MLAALGFLVCLAASSAHAQDCCTPRTEADRTWDEAILHLRGLCADEIGGVFILYADPFRSIEYSLAVSRDGGETWPDATGLGILPSPPPLFACSPRGDLVILYAENLQMRRIHSPDQGLSLVGPDPMSDLPADPGQLRLVLGPGGGAAAAWTIPPSAAPDHGIYTQVSEDGGATWSQARRLPGSESFGSLDDLEVVLLSGSLTLAWVQDQGGVKTAWSAVSTDGGLTWSSPARLDSTSGVGDDEPVRVWLASAPPDELTAAYAVFQEAPPSFFFELRAVASEDRGRSWAGPESGFGQATDPNDMEVAALPGGRVLATWKNFPDGLPHFQQSWDQGRPGSWLADDGLPASAGVEVHHLRLAYDSQGVAWLIHDDYRDDGGAACIDTRCESLYLDRSCDGGLSWASPETQVDSDASPHLVHSEDPEMLARDGGMLHVAWSDLSGTGNSRLRYRRVDLTEGAGSPRLLAEESGGTGPCDPPTWRLSVDPGSLGGCSSPTYTWYRDGVEIPGASGPEWIAVPGPEVMTHVFHVEVACDPPRDCGHGSGRRTLVVPAGPDLELTEELQPATDCESSVHRMEALPDGLAACASVEYLWWLDGDPVPGASGARLDLSGLTQGAHTVTVQVVCDGEPCDLLMRTREIESDPPAGTPVAGPTGGRLFLAKEPPDELALLWQESAPEPSAHSVYRGSLGGWYDHGALACHVERVPPDAPSTEQRVAASEGSLYFLVAPANCLGEGTAGTDSAGSPRPVAGSGPPCGPVP